MVDEHDSSGSDFLEEPLRPDNKLPSNKPADVLMLPEVQREKERQYFLCARLNANATCTHLEVGWF